MNQTNQSSRSRRFPRTLAEQAKMFGYQRFISEKDWDTTLPIPAVDLFRVAAYLARFEGAIFHAQAIEARPPYLRPNFKYKVGRLANGCQTCYIGP